MLGACLDATEVRGDGKKKLEEDLNSRFGDFLAEIDSTVEMNHSSTRLGKAAYIKRKATRKRLGYEELGKLLTSKISGNMVRHLPAIVAAWQNAELSVIDYSGGFQPELQEVIDVLCILIVMDHLNIESVSCSPIPMGEGSIVVKDDEGEDLVLPVPSPATLRLMMGMRTCPGPHGITSVEVVTPSACAILRTLVMLNDGTTQQEQSTMPAVFVPQHVGLGAATSHAGDGTIRLIVGRNETSQALPSVPIPSEFSWKMDTLTHLEANLDDTTAEALAFAIEVLLQNGALDAWVTPIVMKKGRAAHTLHCLSSSNTILTDKLLTAMFRQTTTLGVRIHRDLERAALRRSFVTVQTPFIDETRKGMVDVKIGYLKDEIVSVKPEFDHCKAIALATNVPLKRISDAAIQEFYTSQEKRFSDSTLHDR
jgi:uncharacterized protein (DUF111 family)